MTDLRYPIGRFDFPGQLSPRQRTHAIGDIGDLPAQVRAAVVDLTTSQLDTPYRPDGWTVRQVVHHLPDSHLNAYVRLKLALTEDRPTIRTYEEARWAELPDATAPIDTSLELLDALHARWTYLWRHLDDEAWTRTLHHPELGDLRVDELLAFYAWHGRHHVAHVAGVRTREGW